MQGHLAQVPESYCSTDALLATQESVVQQSWLERAFRLAYLLNRRVLDFLLKLHTESSALASHTEADRIVGGCGDMEAIHLK